MNLKERARKLKTDIPANLFPKMYWKETKNSQKVCGKMENLRNGIMQYQSC